MRWATLGLLLALSGRSAKQVWSSGVLVDLLLPHNQTRCVLEGHNASACAVFSAFNFSTCLNTHFRYPALPRLPTAHASCLLASGCLPLYDVQPCIGAGGFNLTALQFNRSACEHLFGAANVTLPPNATGCAGMNGTDAAMDDDDRGKDDGGDKDDDDGDAEEGLPRFSACVGAYDQEKLRRLDFLSAFQSYVHFMVTAISPNDGPVSGGTAVTICGFGFRLTNENVNHLQCRFSDGDHTKVVPAIYVNERMLHCTSPDFSRYLIGLPHFVTVEVSLNRGQLFSNNGVKFAMFSTRPSIDALGFPMWGYDSTHNKAGWQVKDEYPEAEVGWKVPQLYAPTGHPKSKGVPSPWDQIADPFHTRGDEALVRPVQLDVGDRMPGAEDTDERARLAERHGVEGSWGDRMSFLRAHSLVRDQYRRAVVEARGDARSVGANGVI